MAQRQFRSDDTSKWAPQYGNRSDGDKTVSSSADYDGANAGGGSTANSGQKNVSIDAASTFANGDLVLIHQTRGTGAGAWELNKIASGGGSTSLVMVYDLCNTYTESGASQFQVLELKQYKNVTVNSGQTWSAPSWNGSKGGILGFFANGDVSIVGTINAAGNAASGNTPGSGKGFAGGASGNGGTIAQYGEGSAGAAATASNSNANGNGAGAAYPNNGINGGGGGGHAATGTAGTHQTGSASAGAGGSSVGTAGLTTLFFGGGGGGGSVDGGGAVVAAGAGGGIVVIIGKTITITGSITVNGGKGADTSEYSSGGGGAGGSVLLKGEELVLGTNLITATGGAGGIAQNPNTGGTPNDGGHGGAGSVGRIHADYGKSISGSTNPTIDSREDKTLIQRAPGAGLLMLT